MAAPKEQRGKGDLEDAFAEEKGKAPQAKTAPQPKAKAAAPVKEATFSELERREPGASAQRNLDFLLDVPLEVTVELGRARLRISDLLCLAQGSVVELAKTAGEPLEILVNQKLMARGEVVVVNDRFGVRLTDIISPSERVKQLA